MAEVIGFTSSIRQISSQFTAAFEFFFCDVEMSFERIVKQIAFKITRNNYCVKL